MLTHFNCGITHLFSNICYTKLTSQDSAAFQCPDDRSIYLESCSAPAPNCKVIENLIDVLKRASAVIGTNYLLKVEDCQVIPHKSCIAWIEMCISMFVIHSYRIKLPSSFPSTSLSDMKANTCKSSPLHRACLSMEML